VPIALKESNIRVRKERLISLARLCCRKAVLGTAFLLFTFTSRSDVILFRPYAFFAYSGEFNYSLKMIRYDQAGAGKWMSS